MQNGAFPPRLDGGYGWFLVNETETADETLDETMIGSNNWGDDKTQLYYMLIGKYFNNDVYHNHGIRWIYENKIIDKTVNGIIPIDVINENDCVALLKNNLIFKDENKYMINFPIFDNREQWDAFFNLFYKLGNNFDNAFAKIVSDIHINFKAFVPKQITDGEIKQRVKHYSYNIIGFVAEELIRRGALEKPDEDKPLTNGVFCFKNRGDLRI